VQNIELEKILKEIKEYDVKDRIANNLKFIDIKDDDFVIINSSSFKSEIFIMQIKNSFFNR
jgi:hypothetical protein